MNNLLQTINDTFFYNNDGLYYKKNNKRAGYENPAGYRIIQISGKNHKEHRLVWLIYYGSLPNSDLDHIDRNKSNNNINNLRLATKQQNCYNKGKQKNNSAGFRGVTFYKKSNKFQAQIQINYKKIHLGLFTDINDAIQARKDAEQKYFGMFAPK